MFAMLPTSEGARGHRPLGDVEPAGAGASRRGAIAGLRGYDAQLAALAPDAEVTLDAWLRQGGAPLHLHQPIEILRGLRDWAAEKGMDAPNHWYSHTSVLRQVDRVSSVSLADAPDAVRTEFEGILGLARAWMANWDELAEEAIAQAEEPFGHGGAEGVLGRELDVVRTRAILQHLTEAAMMASAPLAQRAIQMRKLAKEGGYTTALELQDTTVQPGVPASLGGLSLERELSAGAGLFLTDKGVAREGEAAEDEAIAATDVVQGGAGTCYCLAALSSIAAQRPELLQEAITPSGDGYLVRLYRRVDGGRPRFEPVLVGVDARFPRQGTQTRKMAHVSSRRTGGRTPWGAQARSYTYKPTKEDELWPVIMEKAWAKFVEELGTSMYGDGGEGYDTIQGGYIDHALEALTGRPATSDTLPSENADAATKDAMWEKIMGAARADQPMGASMYTDRAIDTLANNQLRSLVRMLESRPSHARALERAAGDGEVVPSAALVRAVYYDDATSQATRSLIDEFLITNGQVVPQHAYAILEAKEERDNRLVKVRNPWGQTTPFDGNMEEHAAEGMGTFWLTLDASLEHFSTISIAGLD